MPFPTFDFERADVRARLAALSFEVKLLRLAHARSRAWWARKDRDGDVEGPTDTDDGEGRVWGQVAQYFPRDHNGPPETIRDDDPPQTENDLVPENKPTVVGELSRLLRYLSNAVAIWGASAVLGSPNTWVVRYYPEIRSNLDAPKAFDELIKDVGTSTAGYQDHHIVEQTPAAQDGFSRESIEGKNNVVKIPTLKHREITAWCSQPNAQYGGLSPREYLKGRSWGERYAVGIQQLIDKGVLKP